MMTAEQLKNSILQLALQGKLVDALPGDKTAKQLLSEDQEKKQKEGRRKDVKQKLVNEIYRSSNGEFVEFISNTEVSVQDRIPFEVPVNWEWIHLGYVCDIARGGSPRPIKSYLTEDPDGINWIKIGDSDIGGKYINQTQERIIPEGMKKSRFVHAGDFLLTNSMSFGRPYILNCDGCIHDGWLVLTGYQNVYDKDFLFYMLSSAFAFNQFCDVVSGAVVKNLNSDKVADAIFPVPPLEEQKRIVAKIEELMPFVEQYAKASTKLNSLNASFPDQMKKSILQYAFQGKLVPQDLREGTASDLIDRIEEEKHRLVKEKRIKKTKVLPPISEEEMFFDIPESWKWVYLGDLFEHNTGKALNGSNRAGEEMPYITTSNLYWDRFELDGLKSMPFTEAEVEKCTVKKGDLLVCEGGDYGRAAIWNFDFDMRIQNHIHRMRAYIPLCTKYFYYVLWLYKQSGMIHGKGIAIQGLSSGALHKLVVPLPPISEQERIVAKLEAVLPRIEKLLNK